jgi:hypothetical protein
MDAHRVLRAWFQAPWLLATMLALGIFMIVADNSSAAGVRTRNFIVQAATPELAQEVAEAAEMYRRELALDWLGHELPPWQDICPITVQVAPQLGAGGATSFTFMNGQPGRWTMTIQGSRERVLDSVLPHEVTHTIFATHFGRPLPRWADEGACTVVEHVSERGKQERLLYEFLTTNRGIPFNRMFVMKDYPQDVLPLYSQGYALARFFIALKGQRQFVAYVGDGMATNDWTTTTRRHYGFESLSDLQLSWVEWVRQGTPPLRSPHDVIYCSTDAAKHGRTLGDVLGLARTAAATENIPLAARADTASPAGKLPLEPISPASAGESVALANATPLSAAWFARHGVAPEGTADRAEFKSVSRPLPTETIQQTPVDWSRRDGALVPSGTWR